MGVTIAAVGRIRGRPEDALVEAYLRRLRPPPVVREVEERRKLPVPQRKAREAELLRAAASPAARLVALDSKGEALTSEAFAKLLERWRDEGIADIAFVIGGADGLDAALVAAADLRLSLGPATWPHLLVRAMLAEQLYRAQQILAGHPYHRG